MVEATTTVSPRGMIHDESTLAATPLSASGWGAVLAGAAVAIGIQFIFTVLGLAIGVSASSTATDTVTPIGFAAGGWWLVTGTISLLIGGLVLGALWSGLYGPRLWLHAAAMWGVVAIFGFMVIWSGAGIASNAASPIAVQEPTWSSTDRPTSEQRAAIAEQVKDATQTAAWWSVVGLLLGLTATMVGAAFAGPSDGGLRRFGRAQPSV